MQAPGGPEEDLTGGFGHGGWSVTYWDDMMGQVMGEATSTPFAMLLGRKTYEIMAAHWPHAPEEEGAGVFNNATKYVKCSLKWRGSCTGSGGLRPVAAEEPAERDGRDSAVKPGHWRRLSAPTLPHAAVAPRHQACKNPATSNCTLQLARDSAPCRCRPGPPAPARRWAGRAGRPG